MLLDKNLYEMLLLEYKDFILSFYVLNTVAIFVNSLIFFLIYNDFSKTNIILNIIFLSFTISIYLITLFLNVYTLCKNNIYNNQVNIIHNIVYFNYISSIIKIGVFKNIIIIIFSSVNLYYVNDTKSGSITSLKVFYLIGIFISSWIGLFSHIYTKIIKETIRKLTLCIEDEDENYFHELTNITVDNCSICLNEMNSTNINIDNRQQDSITFYQSLNREEYQNNKKVEKSNIPDTIGITEKLLTNEVTSELEKLSINHKDKVIMLKRCNHSFHKECITKWMNLKNSCPICRENIIN